MTGSNIHLSAVMDRLHKSFAISEYQLPLNEFSRVALLSTIAHKVEAPVWEIVTRNLKIKIELSGELHGPRN